MSHERAPAETVAFLSLDPAGCLRDHCGLSETEPMPPSVQQQFECGVAPPADTWAAAQTSAARPSVTDPEDKTSAGLKRAIEAAMAIHRGYPANKASLTGKQGKSIGFKTPLEIPGLTGKYKLELDWEGQVVKSCIHCHQIGQALREDYRDKNKPLPLSLIYPWPEPETIGITLAPDHVAKIETAIADSPADKAGLKALPA